MHEGIKLAEGKTEDGEHVLVRRSEGSPYGTHTVEIDGRRVDVERVSRLRDGGTTILNLAGARVIEFPSQIRRKDHTPLLDGKRIIGGTGAERS